MNIGQKEFDSFVFHDAVLKAISFDVEAEIIRITVENESETDKLDIITLTFKNVSNFNFDTGDFFKISEISSLQINKKEHSYCFEMIVLQGFGEPSGMISFYFSEFEAVVMY